MKPSIRNMIGRQFKFEKSLETITEITHKEGDIFIVTLASGRSFPSSEDELKQDFIPVVNAELAKRQADMIQGAANSFAAMDKLTDVLMDTIEKVKADSGYVAQANAINNSVKQVVEINKAKIEAMKLVRDMQ